MTSRREINAEELQALYSAIGQGIWHLQNVEDALHTYITVKRDVRVRASVRLEKAEELLLKNRSRTLGKSLRIAREAQVLSPSLQERIDTFKEERDWLVHRSVYQNRQDLYVENKRHLLIARIQAFSTEATVLQKLIAKELEEFVISQGVSREEVMRIAEENLMKLRGESP
jgi:hypothetical protein